MPDWSQEIIHNVQLVAVLGLYPVCFKVFALVEDRLSVSGKQEIAAWLKSAGDFAEQHTLSFNLLRFHSELFGHKQLSVKCLVRTALFSLTSFLLVFLPYIIANSLYMPKLPATLGGFKFHDDAPTFFEELLFASFILLVLPLDFFGVAVTRKLAGLAGNNVTLKKVALIFISDTLTKSVIFPLIISAC